MSTPVAGTLAALRRRPIKGFTPEPLTAAALAPSPGALLRERAPEWA